MAELSSSVLFSFFLFFLIPFLISLLTNKFKLSPVSGYLIGGIILANIFGNFYSKEVINHFAYFGIILLLFTVGLEIDFNQILNLKKYIVFGGFLQLGLSFIFIFLINLLFKFDLLTATLIAITLCSSSTTLVAKIIEDRGEEGTFLGELAIGILMFQDLAFIPFLIIFSSIVGSDTSFFKVFFNIFFSFLKAVIIIYSLYFFGKKTVPLIFNKITRFSREILNLFIIVFIFFITYLSTLLGIPTLIGVFIAGILVGKTLEHRHIFSQIRPIRDLLAMIFFIYIGFNLQLGLALSLLFRLISFFILVVFVKWLIVFLIFSYFRLHSRISFSLATYLFQIDEDAFILLSLGYLNKLINLEDYTFVIGVVILTLILTPIFIENKNFLYERLKIIFKKNLPFLGNYFHYQIDRDVSTINELNLNNHIVICGYGRVGRCVGRALMLAGIPFVAVDYNIRVVDQAKKEGSNIVYGDACDIDILDYLDVDRARLLVCALPDRRSQETVIINAKKLNQKIIILTRIQKEGDQKRIKDLGGQIVIQPEFEASKSIIQRLLFWQGLDKNEISRQIKRIKVEYGLV